MILKARTNEVTECNNKIMNMIAEFKKIKKYSINILVLPVYISVSEGTMPEMEIDDVFSVTEVYLKYMKRGKATELYDGECFEE